MDEKNYAAISYALGVTRGMLYDVINDDFDLSQIQRVLVSTSASEIAKVLNQKESDIAIDWRDFLSDEEKYKIAGNE